MNDASVPSIPVFDLGRALERIRPDLDREWSELLAARRFIGGEAVDRFEREFADQVGGAGCVGVANGTDALILALKSLGLGYGDEVIVPAFTFIATAATVAWLGARPVFADVEPTTLNIDPASVADRISDRTVGVIGVHLYGRPCAVEELTELCRERRLWFLEDAAQAHGARVGDRPVGSFGKLATWSFYPSKNLGCFGDGGAVTSGSEALLEKVRRLANHGREEHYFHREVGVNSRLDALQAAVLNCRLSLLEGDNARRREIACRYWGGLDALPGLEFLEDAPGTTAVYHQMTVRVSEREALRRHLAEHGVGSAVHYPHALHEQPAFAALGFGPEDLPEATRAAADVLCLPMFPELTDDEVDRVCRAVRAFWSGR